MMKATNGTRRNGTVRCAIYTRKSSEEGLEQEFNSLRAQREACEAFITSQRHEGWVCLPKAYDDGGFSGATIDRPALQQLLADLTAIPVIVITPSIGLKGRREGGGDPCRRHEYKLHTNGNAGQGGRGSSPESMEGTRARRAVPSRATERRAWGG